MELRFSVVFRSLKENRVARPAREVSEKVIRGAFFHANQYQTLDVQGQTLVPRLMAGSPASTREASFFHAGLPTCCNKNDASVKTDH